MKIIRILIVLFLVTGCQKKEILLPQLGENGITDIYNNSKIWIFFDVVEGDTIGIFNKKNKIADTNLIFNIDKRLPLKEVIPRIKKVKYDALNAPVHKTIGKGFYLSFADTISGTFALYDFTKTQYIFTPEENRNLLDTLKKTVSVINVKKNEILLNHKKTDNLNSSVQEIFKNDSLHKNTLLLKFRNDISYSEYLSLRVQLHNKGYAIENIEYVYNEE